MCISGLKAILMPSRMAFLMCQHWSKGKSYMIRATPVSSADAIYCGQLAEDAVHAAMAGFTETLIGLWGGVGVLVPFSCLQRHEKRINLDGALWRNVLDATGQPSSLQSSRE